ncbi:MAG: hypothetical protein OXD49_20660, partial [Candidatus Poribacteria bacterium]|nr:hypothetical protein [Candidatus Poribacteria bacterium]
MTWLFCVLMIKAISVSTGTFNLALKSTIQVPSRGRDPFMKFRLYPVLFIVLMMPFSVSAETESPKE